MNAVIINMEGIIINSKAMYAQANLAMLQRLDVGASVDCLEKYTGFTDSARWQGILDEHGNTMELQELLNALLSIKLKLLKKGEFAPVEGVVELLGSLSHNRIPVVIVSASPGIFIKEVVKKFRLDRYVWNWVSGESLTKSKSASDIYLKAAESIDVGPEGCIVFENSRNGVIAAKQAGMKCVGIANPVSGSQDVNKADLVVAGLKEITIDVLKKL